ncbi:glycosyltransferase family 2 protein [Bradyrhizobium sp. WSM471]|uniref:glycosyltransferase family 2 protein n=1 Tax=Bradyrhizobium sp. WSM471 TaxID=319017 RepID=UPI00024D21BF|nr:hypothetical protein Bra471DRAFT_02041 [Bradyrhizobium sp. WSM471]
MNQCAVVTMVYNEPAFLPHWIRYYSKQFGADHCYIVDHGSDDGSTRDVDGTNLVRIPRSPMHDKKRANFISQFCTSLLEWYETVIYTDVDEFLIPEPDRYSSLAEYCANNQSESVNAIGLNIIHVPDLEQDLDTTRPMIGQRQWVRFSFAMCKPLLVRSPTKWTPGFHSSNHPIRFDQLFLFHARNFDLPTSLKRLEKTRAMPWGDGPPDHYQRWTADQHEQIVRAQAGLPKLRTSLHADAPHIKKHLDWIESFVKQHPDQKDLFYYNNGVRCDELLLIPDRFHGYV